MEFLQNPTNWVALAFVLFMFGFFRLAGKPLAKGLDGRSERIKSELEEAIRLKEEAQELLSEYQQKQKEVLADAETILKQAEKEAEIMRKDAEKALATSIERRTQMAHDRIARAEAEAVADIQSLMVSLSCDAAKNLVSEKLDAKQNEKLIQDALGDAKRLVH